MKILIIGAGSIGVYLGTLLYSKKHNVTLLGREKLKKLHDTILINTTLYKLPNRIYTFPKNETFDLIFITSKLYDLKENLQNIQNNNLKTKYLASIQNGLVKESLYKPFIKNTNYTSISVFEGFRLIENQLTTSHSKIGWKTDDSETGRTISKLLLASKINCTTSKDLDSIKAEKTIMNCSINLLSAIEKKTFFELCMNQETKEVINQLFDESYIILSQLYPLKNKELFRKEFFETISQMRHYSSTYQDAISKRKNEAEFLNGLIISLGKKLNIPTPFNERILKQFNRKYKK
jgi:2-dehydropantoate 2-reductase